MQLQVTTQFIGTKGSIKVLLDVDQELFNSLTNANKQLYLKQQVKSVLLDTMRITYEELKPCHNTLENLAETPKQPLLF